MSEEIKPSSQAWGCTRRRYYKVFLNFYAVIDEDPLTNERILINPNDKSFGFTAAHIIGEIWWFEPKSFKVWRKQTAGHTWDKITIK